MSTTKTSAQVPKLRFPGFEGAWRECAFGEVASVKHGFAFDGEHFASEGDFIVLTPGNFTADGAFRYQGAKEKFYTSNEFPQEYVLSRGDLLMVMTEQAVGLIGCTLLVPEDGRLLHNQRLGLIQIHGAADAEYLHRYFKTERMRVALSKTGAGTKVRHTSPKRIEGLQINLPTVPEQQKIAAFLTAVDGRIEQLSRKKALLAEYKKGVMQQLFTQTLRFQDDHGHDFLDWEEKPLCEVVTINPKARELPDSFTYIDLESVDSGVLHSPKQINKADAPSRAQRLLQPQDILYQTVRPYQMNNLFFDLDGTYVASTGYAQLRATKHNPRYIYYAMHVATFVNAVMDRCTGTSFPAINSKDLGDISIPIPSLPEQTKIASFLSALDGKIGAVGEQMRQTQAWKKGLLQQLFV